MNLAEIAHPDYAGERLVCCKNPFLAAERARKREALLVATEADLEKVAAAVSAGRLRDPGKIGLRAGRVLNHHKTAKRFEIEIGDCHFSYSRKKRPQALRHLRQDDPQAQGRDPLGDSPRRQQCPP